MFRGSITALITPFIGGKVDERAFQKFVAWQVSEGTHGLVPCGTTGESATLTHEEHKKMVTLCVEAAASRVPVIAGTGSNSTEEAIELTRQAHMAGATAALVVTPYYNKPTQEGLFHHFKSIHDAVDIPILIYNIPGRCSVDLSLDTLTRLAKLPNVIGIKDATSDLSRPLKTRLKIGKAFCQLSGEDITAVAFLAQGGHGCISVSSNIVPSMCAQLQDAWRVRDRETVSSLRDRLMPLHEVLFCETNPGPVKYAASLLGYCSSETRQPLWKVSEINQRRIKEVLTTLSLI